MGTRLRFLASYLMGPLWVIQAHTAGIRQALKCNTSFLCVEDWEISRSNEKQRRHCRKGLRNMLNVIQIRKSAFEEICPCCRFLNTIFICNLSNHMSLHSLLFTYLLIQIRTVHINHCVSKQPQNIFVRISTRSIFR